MKPIEVRATTGALSAFDKRPIYVTNGLFTKEYLPNLEGMVKGPLAGEFLGTDRPPDKGGWVLSWGYPIRPKRNGVFETGFFWQAGHVDMTALYTCSSFNQPGAMEEVLAFRAPISAADIVLSGQVPPSKYTQDMEDVEWEGVVLPLQVPCDRSVQDVGDTGDYWRFIEGACKKYGKHLLLKAHPLMDSNSRGWAMHLAWQYGSTYAMTNHSCLRRCKFVLTYNSTFCVDAFLHSKPVAQFVPGYFFKTGAVTYADGRYPDEVPDTTEIGHRLADFLMWKYCFGVLMPVENWISLFRHYANSLLRFPMTDEWSYGANLERVTKKDIGH